MAAGHQYRRTERSHEQQDVEFVVVAFASLKISVRQQHECHAGGHDEPNVEQGIAVEHQQRRDLERHYWRGDPQGREGRCQADEGQGGGEPMVPMHRDRKHDNNRRTGDDEQRQQCDQFVSASRSSPRSQLLQPRHGRLEGIQHGPRVQAQPEQGHDHQRYHQTLTRHQVRNPPVVRIRSLEGPLYQPQCVKCGEQDPHRGQRRQDDAHLIGTQQNQKLPHEIAKAGEPQGCERKKQGRAAEARSGTPQPAHAVHFPRMNALLQRAHQNEQRASTDAVTDHGHHGSLKRQVIPGEDAQKDEAQVAHAGVRDQALQVCLPKGQDCAIEDSRHS